MSDIVNDELGYINECLNNCEIIKNFQREISESKENQKAIIEEIHQSEMDNNKKIFELKDELNQKQIDIQNSVPFSYNNDIMDAYKTTYSKPHDLYDNIRQIENNYPEYKVFDKEIHEINEKFTQFYESQLTVQKLKNELENILVHFNDSPEYEYIWQEFVGNFYQDFNLQNTSLINVSRENLVKKILLEAEKLESKKVEDKNSKINDMFMSEIQQYYIIEKGYTKLKESIEQFKSKCAYTTKDYCDNDDSIYKHLMSSINSANFDFSKWEQNKLKEFTHKIILNVPNIYYTEIQGTNPIELDNLFNNLKELFYDQRQFNGVINTEYDENLLNIIDKITTIYQSTKTSLSQISLPKPQFALSNTN